MMIVVKYVPASYSASAKEGEINKIAKTGRIISVLKDDGFWAVVVQQRGRNTRLEL